MANDKVGSVEATDRDGTAPGNLVRYQIGNDGMEQCQELRQISESEDRDGTVPGPSSDIRERGQG